MPRRPSPRLLIWLVSVLALAGSALPAAAQEEPPEEEEPRFIGRMLDVGTDTFEPTLGADRDGNLFYAEATGDGVAIGFKAGMYRSTDGGTTWSDVSPKIQGHNIPPETNDPYIYVDPTTGRIFSFHMSPILTCSILSYSDDQGATWTTNPAGCFPTVVWDHQTIVAAKPRTLPTTGYPTILHQCVNAIYAAMCTRSLDGGLTWAPPTVAYANPHAEGTPAPPIVGAQHGHLTAAPDGTLYLPTPMGGYRPTVYVSENDGLTWTKRVIADVSIPFTDPSVAVDSEGNVYASFVDRPGNLLFAVSRDKGATWTEPVVAAPGITAHMPVIVAGDPGKVAIAYPGTDDLADGFDTSPWPSRAEHAWYPYFSVSYDALADSPTFESLSASETDPIERTGSSGSPPCARGGRCIYQVDFIEAVLGPDGVPYASFADGCTGPCAANPSANNNESFPGSGVVATLSKMPAPLCETLCARYGSP